MCFSQLVSHAKDAVNERTSGKKKGNDQASQIHEAISQAKSDVPYESSKISQLLKLYSEKEEVSSKRRP